LVLENGKRRNAKVGKIFGKQIKTEASFIHGVRTLGEKCPPLAVRYCNEYNRIIRRKERKY